MTERRKTAIYLRISTEDYTARTAYRGQEESFSISHQREFLLDYIKKDKMLEDNDVLEFCDDGFTGTNMERPGMQEMLQAEQDWVHPCERFFPLFQELYRGREISEPGVPSHGSGIHCHQ